MAAVIPRVREFERIRALDLDLPFLIAREAHPGEGHRIVQELELIALAGRASRAHRALARLQAIGPQPPAKHDEEQHGDRLPYRPIIGMPPASTCRRPSP